jgi:hypothetical protein
MQTKPLFSPHIGFDPATDYVRSNDEAAMGTFGSPGYRKDRPFLMAYVLVTLFALLAGYILGQLGSQPSNESRVGWPPLPANPRSLNP